MKDLNKEFGPSSWAIDNKTAIYVLIFLITVLGFVSYNNLPKENFPDIAQSKVFVSTPYIGQSPQNIELLVTRQLEKQLKSLKGLKKVTSNSKQNISVITAEFNADVKIRDAKIDVKEAVDKAKQDLPQNDDNLKESIISDINVADIPILYVNISGDYDLKKLKEYADNLKDDIESFKEISRVEEVGALTPEIQINVDMNKMAAVQLSFNDITQAIGNENIIASAGNVTTDGIRRSIDIKKDYKSADEVSEMVVRNPKGQPIYLRDIAEIKDSFLEQESYARLKTNDSKDFKNVITLNVSKRTGENLIEASDKINSLISQKLKTVFPKGLKITVTGDQSDKTRTTLNDLINTIVIGFILVTIILMFFMGTTNAIFVALSVPLSCFIAFLVMPAIGFTLNMIVLFAFLLALGIVVDDAIVVIENTHRLFDNGKREIKVAAKMAAGEIFLPVLSGTLTTLAPFIPLAFWSGIIGKFMFFLPITLIVTLLASLFVAYVINPVFAVDFMKTHDQEKAKYGRLTKLAKIQLSLYILAAVLAHLSGHAAFGNLVLFFAAFMVLHRFWLHKIIEGFQTKAWPAFQRGYTKMLLVFLKNPWKALLGTLVLFVLAVMFFAVRSPKVVFFPQGDPNFVYVYVKLPTGTDPAITNKVMLKVEQKVNGVLGDSNKIVKSIITNVTKQTTDPADQDQSDHQNQGKIAISFVDFDKREGQSTAKILATLQNFDWNIPGAEINVTKEQSGPPVSKPINIEVRGDDFDELVKNASALKLYIENQKVAGVEKLK